MSYTGPCSTGVNPLNKGDFDATEHKTGPVNQKLGRLLPRALCLEISPRLFYPVLLGMQPWLWSMDHSLGDSFSSSLKKKAEAGFRQEPPQPMSRDHLPG